MLSLEEIVQCAITLVDTTIRKIVLRNTAFKDK